MRECEQDILEQYDIDVKNIRRVREAYLCETDRGPFLLKELRVSEKRVPMLFRLGEHLQEQGVSDVDWILKNKDGELFCVSEEGTKFFMKKWFTGKECDVKKENELLSAVKNLTKIHQALRVPVSWESAKQVVHRGEDLEQEFFRHNRELKKVRAFIRERVGKGSFEQAFLQNFDAMFEWAECAAERLKASNYKVLLEESREKHFLVHGDYNYHNVLMLHTGVATTNFEHFQENVQVTDLYYFLRKTMEKHHWDVALGDKMLEYYQRFLSLSSDELEYIGICIAYPEKFWKAANSYYRSKKVWIPAKNLEKLELVIKQTEEKRIFLEKLFSFHL
ncbi:MAG: CotS family spore coat protein [Tyzzerella sp.]|nr:CotS family spore coat protein [Tyzzerella sp.]